jgi:dTDP-glucose pyrophosphorylase/CBS domain-containing protein
MLEKANNILTSDSSIRTALEKLTLLGETLTLFIVDPNSILIGVVTDGDIRRGLIKGCELDEAVIKIMNKKFKSINEDQLSIELIDDLKKSSAKIIPILDKNNKIVRFVNISKIKSVLPVHAIIMAGGKGERLLPLTLDTPKPMLEVCGKPIIEHNIDLLAKYGIGNLHISVNYLKDIIKNYFSNGENKNITIHYLDEEKPLGTFGSIKLTNSYKYADLLIMNSDLLTNINIADFYKSFKDSNADMAIATTSYLVNIPYAVLETKNGYVKSFKEKPTYTYFSNAGIYLIKKDLINEIPDNEFYNATDLINKLINSNRIVLTYPILGYWLDIGRHEDYKKANEDFKHINF